MWYLNSGLKPLGPFSEFELQEKIKKGQLGPSDLVFHQESNEWKMAIEWEALKRIGFPAFEAVNAHDTEAQIWVVLKFDDASKSFRQEGPYTVQQIRKAREEGHISAADLVWKTGLSGWARLQDRQEFI